MTVGESAPDFELKEPLTGKTVKLADFKGAQGLLVMFICNHCPVSAAKLIQLFVMILVHACSLVCAQSAFCNLSLGRRCWDYNSWLIDIRAVSFRIENSAIGFSCC